MAFYRTGFIFACATAVTVSFAATETLFGNSAFLVAPAKDEGALWVLSRGDVATGMTLLNVKVGVLQN